MQIVLVGNVVDGIEAFGPLKDEHTIDWLHDEFDEWVVVTVTPLD